MSARVPTMSGFRCSGWDGGGAQALLAAGYPNSVLPLTGITYMATRDTVGEDMLLLQLDFPRRAWASRIPPIDVISRTPMV
jgi:hypothetical protein